ncbi:MAG: tetratricopeptide repeat protein [Magnetococcales bacterium]|nr:tetratricopeptide repeat protein [Nitrospirota bacterium]
MPNVTIKISDAVNGQHAVHIAGELPHHIAQDEVAKLLTLTRNNLWCIDPTAGSNIGMLLYNLLNRSAGTLQTIVDAARANGEHTHLHLQVPYELTQLPFELLHNGSWLLLTHNIHVIRLVEDRGELTAMKQKEEPLRMLFMACSPTDLHDTKVLGFDKEEERIFSHVGNYNIDMRIEDTGSLEGLKQANIAGGGFDVIHITGHAGFDKDMGPVFYMEDEVGRLQKVSSAMLWDAIKDFPPKVLFLSGCSTGEAYEAASSESLYAGGGSPLAYKIAKKGVKWVLGWGLPVSDEGAMLIAAEVYRCLSIGKGLDHAVQSARRLLEVRYHPWPLLRVFGDAAPIVPLVKPGLPVQGVNPVKLRHKSLKETKVMVLESGFVGRRRYVQEGVIALRGEAGKFGLLVRGPAGIGKSCLVGKLIERFKDKDLVVFHGVVSEANVILKLRRLLDEIGNRDALKIIKSDDKYAEKIKDLFRHVFKEQLSVIIYFDDFEQNLDRHGNQYYVKTEAIDIIRPFLEAAGWSRGNSNVVISSRYAFILEHDGENLSTTNLHDLTVMSFDGADLDKKKRDLEFIAKSKHVALYLKYGAGNPRLLEWLNVIARDEGKYDLAGIEAKLKGKQDEFIHAYLADVIAATEGEEFHRFIQKAAVYGEAVYATAFEAFAGGQFLATGVDLTLVEREDLSRGEFVYWVTPVIRDAMWAKLTADERLEMHAHAYQWYDGWISGATESNYRYMEEAVRHALEVGNVRGACPHARALGRYFDEMVLYRQGRAIMEKVAVRVSDAVIDEAKASKDVKVGDFLHMYAYSLWQLGDSRQAIAFYEKSLAIRLEVYGKKHLDVATSYNSIGSAWDMLGDSRQAIKFFEKAIEIINVVYGETHPDVATSYNNIGEAWRALGDYRQAIGFYEKAIEIIKAVYGERHQYVAASYNNIGLALRALGEARQAMVFYEKALAIQLEIYGEKHPDVAQTYNNIGVALGSLGEASQAIVFNEKSLAIKLEIYGEKHPDVAQSYNNIGMIRYMLGETRQAIALVEKAIEIRLEIYGERHPHIASSYNNLAYVFRQTGDTQKADFYAAKAKAAWP